MIASLSGTIIHSGTERLVVEVGGVGLAVTTSAATCAAVSATSMSRSPPRLLFARIPDTLRIPGIKRP